MKHGLILATGLAGGQCAGAGGSDDCAAQRSRAGADPGIPADESGARGAGSAAGPTGRDLAACAIAQLCPAARSFVVERHAISLAGGAICREAGGICDLYARPLGAAGERLGLGRRSLGLPGCRQQHTTGVVSVREVEDSSAQKIGPAAGNGINQWMN
jgi:hypothetical protein